VAEEDHWLEVSTEFDAEIELDTSIDDSAALDDIGTLELVFKEDGAADDETLAALQVPKLSWQPFPQYLLEKPLKER
jgi:hypothetical protein